MDKTQLTARSRGKGGTQVRLIRDMTFTTGQPTIGAGTVLVVKDLMTRGSYNQPNRVGVGPAAFGWAVGVGLDEIELV